MLKNLLGFVAVLVLIAGCGNNKMIRPGDSLPEAFRKAKGLYVSENYNDATQAFETVISIGRGTEYAMEAQYLLAESYFKNGEYLLAASEYDRYANYYPQAEKREEVDFKQALCYYKLSPNYKLDQKYTQKAIELYKLFNSRYPNSDRTGEAGKYIDKLRTKLAHKYYHAAELYLRIDEYEAAAIYYGLTIDNYPETSWSEQALVKQIYAYIVYARNSVSSKQDDRYQKAIDAYEKYVQLFPKGEHRSQAEEYHDMARVALAKIENTSNTDSSGSASASESTATSSRN